MPEIEPEALRELIEVWRRDPESSYNTWFLGAERLRNFRSLRPGIWRVVEEIKAGTFGNAYRGSSLESVVHAIAQQRPIFKGADHAFLWKPKLRIPDIYESRNNQLAFGRFLDKCFCCDAGDEVVSAIHEIDALAIKGLGPAAANLLYFLHPTLVCPFNTAIAKGYNLVTGGRVKLGSWQHYLTMRQGVVHLNAAYRDLFSNDLGAIAGFLFDVGSERYKTPAADTPAARAAWVADLANVRIQAREESAAMRASRSTDSTHSEIQGWLRDLGIGLGFDVWIASNDRNRDHEGSKLGDNCLGDLPAQVAKMAFAESIRLIDVLWFRKDDGHAAAAFEVEHTTSIYSGIVRMLDLAMASQGEISLFIVAPDERENEVRAQLGRPAFSRFGDVDVRFLPYSELQLHRTSMARFGAGLRAVNAVARRLI